MPFSFLKEILFPKVCFGCGRLGSYFCLHCAKKLKTVKKDTCPYCQKWSFFGLTHFQCQRKLGLNGLKSFYYYDERLRKLIKEIKYQLVREAIADFWRLVPFKKIEELFFYRKLTQEIFFLPVPLHLQREKRRGFNQAFELVKFLSQFLGIKIKDDLIIRVKETKPQAELKTPKERYFNLLGAFSVKDKAKKEAIQGKNFIIFDDVWTTGATIKEITKVLKRNGANKVFALTIAQ